MTPIGLWSSSNFHKATFPFRYFFPIIWSLELSKGRVKHTHNPLQTVTWIKTMPLYLFVCLSWTSLLNIWGHITTVPACSSGTFSNVQPHRNAMQQTQGMTPHPVTVYWHRADLSLCYLLMWNVTLNTQLPILMYWVRLDLEILPRPSTHTSKCSTLWCCCCYGGNQSEAW